MIYLFSSELLKNKSLLLSLCAIYGLGKHHSFLVCKKLGFSKNLAVQALSKEQISKLVSCIESLNVLVAGDLLKARLIIAKQLVFIKSYRGLRGSKGFPVRGQRTHTNAKTSRKRQKK